jgi:CrcB protein
MGGLTTYSSFNYETMQLARNSAVGASVLNFGVTTLGCFLAGFLGFVLAERLLGV